MDWEDVKYKSLQDKIKFDHNIVMHYVVYIKKVINIYGQRIK